MSRIGKKPIPVPAGVEVKAVDGLVTVKGPLGTLSRKIIGAKVVVEKGVVNVLIDETQQKPDAMHGLNRTLVANMVNGVSTGFQKILVITGTGYKVEATTPTQLTFFLGFSKPVIFPLLPDVTAVVEDKNTKVTLKSINKESLGLMAAKAHDLRPIEPYKGKGVAYKDEKVRRKVGKAGTK